MIASIRGDSNSMLVRGGGEGGVIGVDSKKVDVCEIGEKFEQENSASEE